MEMVNRNDPQYTEAVIKKKSQSDSKEVSIRKKIEDAILREEWAKTAFSHIKDEQIEYLKKSIAKVDNPDFVHDSTQDTLKKISRELKAQIVEGAELLSEVPEGSPILISTNHFGAYKLTGLNPKTDLGIDIENYDAMYPYLMYFAALHPVSEAVQDNLYYVSDDFPLIFGQIHTEAGFIHVPPSSIEISGGRTAFLEEQVKKSIAKHPNSAFVNFPEGGTSGKYTGLGPYDLDPFKTGAYVVAANLGIHVVPVAQYFDKNDGFQLKIFKPFIPEITDKTGYENMAQNNRAEMQKWLDTRKNN